MLQPLNILFREGNGRKKPEEVLDREATVFHVIGDGASLSSQKPVDRYRR